MNKIFYRDYRNLFKNGNKLYSSPYVVYYIDFHKQVLKTAAKKKLGKAVSRNYEKRIVRNIVSKFPFKRNYFILVICQRCLNTDFEGKKKHLKQLLKPLLTLPGC